MAENGICVPTPVKRHCAGAAAPPAAENVEDVLATPGGAPINLHLVVPTIGQNAGIGFPSNPGG